MIHLYQSELETIERALKAYNVAHNGGTVDDQRLLKKVSEMKVEEESRVNRD